MDEVIDTIFSTRYALSKGIEECRVIEYDGQYAKVVALEMPNGWNLLGRGDWYGTLTQAQARAERMRKDRIASLERQVSGLRAKEIRVHRLAVSASCEEDHPK